MKNFLNISDLSSKSLREIIEEAKVRKSKRLSLNKSAADIDQPFAGKSMIMIFEKPSTRTRISFDIAVKQLGGSTIILNTDNIHYGIGDESIKDTAKILSEYGDVVMIRTSQHKKLEDFAKFSNIPVINGLSEQSHPCQIMSDILTFEEIKGNIKGKTIAWLGDGNNVLVSWIEAAAVFGFELRIACPEAYSPPAELLAWARAKGGDIILYEDPMEAARDSQTIVTDVWISMGDEEGTRDVDFAPYQVNADLMKVAAGDAIFMHCLPAIRDKEVTGEVIDGSQSVVFDEAENRLHVQKAIMRHCLGV